MSYPQQIRLIIIMIETHQALQGGGEHGGDVVALDVWRSEAFRPSDEYTVVDSQLAMND